MNFLLHLTPAQWDWIEATANAMGVDPFVVVYRLLELGQPVLDKQVKLRPRKRAALKLVRP